jgi:hypothetical protein
MAFASVTYTSASGTTFALTNNDGNAIEYLRQSDISVTVNGTLQTLTTDYTFNAAGTSIVLNSAVSGATVVLSRITSITDATVSFTAGSTLTAQDLNNSDRQNRFALQEFSDTYGAITTGTGDLQVLGGFIGSAETWVADNAHAATTGAIDARIDSKTATKLTDDVVAGNAITVTDNSPSAGKITIAVTDGAIEAAELASNAVTTVKIADSNVTTAKINDAAVTTAKIADANVTTTKLANDSVTSAKIADGTIIAGDIAADAITTAKILDANVTTAKIADANVTAAKLATDSVTTTKIADSNVTAGKIASDAVTTAKIQDGAVTNAKLADAELQTLAGMNSTAATNLVALTAAEIQTLDGITASTAELNQLDGITVSTSFNNSATELATSSAVNTYVVGLMDSLGGFVAIADDQSFPETNPDPSDNAGTVVSIADAGGLVINGSGVSTTGRTVSTTSTVTITGFPASLQSITLAAGLGLQVQTTTTLNTYTYHKLIAKETDVIQLSQDIEDFNNRYRVAATNPTVDNDEGDLVFNTTDDVLRVFDGTNWVTAAAANASQVASTATGDIAATNVQAALAELDTEKVPRTSTIGSAKLPSGTTGERDGSPSAGYIRFNTTNTGFEGYNGTAWGSIGGGASGGGSDAVFYENGQTVTTSYTISSNSNAMSAGPITINSGVTVTIPSGSNWVIV